MTTLNATHVATRGFEKNPLARRTPEKKGPSFRYSDCGTAPRLRQKYQVAMLR